MPRAAVTLCVFLLCAAFFAFPACSHARETDHLKIYSFAEKLGGTVVGDKWIVSQPKSAKGGKEEATVSLISEETLAGKDQALLVAVIKGKTIAVGFAFTEKNMGKGRTKFEYKVDGQPMAKSESLSSGTSLFVVDPNSFLKSLPGRKKLFIRAYPASGGRVDLSFNIEGIEDILPIGRGGSQPRAPQKDFLVFLAEKLGGSLVDDKWIVQRERIGKDVKDTVTVTLVDEKGRHGRHASQFVMSYGSRTQVAFIFTGKSMGSKIEYKIDGQPVKKEEWQAKGPIAFAPDPTRFLNSLAGRKKLTVRGYPASGGSVELSFNIAGIEKVYPFPQNKAQPRPQKKAPLALLAESVGGSVVNGKWIVQKEKSDKDGKNSLFVYLPDERGIQQDGASMFIMSCTGAQTTAGFLFSGQFMGEKHARIEYIIDDHPVKKEEWLALKANVFTFRSIPFLKSLVGRKKLFVRGYPATGGSVDLIFNIEGIEKVLPLIQNECGWK